MNKWHSIKVISIAKTPQNTRNIMEPEWNIPDEQSDSVMLGLVDIELKSNTD